MGLRLYLDEEELMAKVFEKAEDTFQTEDTFEAQDTFEVQHAKMQLQVTRTVKTSIGEQNGAIYVSRNENVRNVSHIEALQCESDDSSQVFVIQQDRSWTNLNISLELFRGFLNIYNVFPQFWKCVFTFGRKYEENEFQFPGFMAGRSPSYQHNDVNASKSYESAYVLRRVELNGRALAEGQSPWSIRQTAVYHKLSQNSSVGSLQGSKSIFLLIAPSQNVEQRLSQSLQLSILNRSTLSSCSIQKLLVADSLRGWMDYMVWLETQLKEHSNRIVFARVGTREEHLSPLMEFNINFMDRQALSLLEDSITNLQIILPTCLSTVVRIREQCQTCCNINCSHKEKKCNCDQDLQQFDEFIKELELYVMRADVLRDKAKCTTQLLSDLLNYENAVALRSVAHESQQESKSMTQLTVKSTKDAAAVKVLTIISLIYLPTTIVANFFSTQFVHTNDIGNMVVSANAWLLAAIALPLTVITIGTWWSWTHYKMTSPQKFLQQFSLPRLRVPKVRLHKLKAPNFQHGTHFWHSLIWGERQPLDNLETGMCPQTNISPQGTLQLSKVSPHAFCNSSQGTWPPPAPPMTRQNQ